MRILVASTAVLFGILCAAHAAEISGRVTDEAGEPIANAEVYVEHGLAGPVEQTHSDANGRFHFGNVRSGLAGVFAVADGYAFGGRSVRTDAGDARQAIIPLRSPRTLSGVVSTANGESLKGALIRRVLLQEPYQTSIPLHKMQDYGYGPAETDDGGRFRLPRMPKDTGLALKISHPAYAQAAVEVSAGEGSARVQMDKGIVLRGTVRTRDGDVPVPNAAVLLRNNAPPRSTTVVLSDSQGEFTARLAPGAYGARAASADARGGWQKVIVSGEQPIIEAHLRVAGTASLTGYVQDALTRAPVQGARLLLRTGGNPADVARTGSKGAFVLLGAAGSNTVQIEAPAGYETPAKSLLALELEAGQEAVLPTIWLKPVGNFRIAVLGPDDAISEGAVRVLDPPQIGLWPLDSAGAAELRLASMPSDGPVVLAASVKAPLMALHWYEGEQRDATVELAPCAALRAEVVDENGEPAAGASVEIHAKPEGRSGSVLLWRTVSGPDGALEWPYLPPQTMIFLRVGAATPDLSPTLRTKPATVVDFGPLRLGSAPSGRSIRGERFDWAPLDLPRAATGGPALVMYVSAAESALAAELLDRTAKIAESRGLSFVLVQTEGDAPAPMNPPLYAASGQPPASASTYLVSAAGRVVLETLGIPPLPAISALAAPQE